MRVKRHKYSRRTPVNVGRKRVFPIVIVTILSVVVVTLSAIGIGAYLRNVAENYTSSDDYEFEGNVPTGGSARAVSAPLYSYGDYVRGHINKGYTDFSMSLGSASKPVVASDVADAYLGLSGEIKLDEYTSTIHKYDGRACVYFESEAFECEDENLRRIKKSYEISFLCEATDDGADDILILGIDVRDDNFEEIVSFIKELKTSTPDCSVGVAVNTAVIQLSKQGDYLAGGLLRVCDYIALDLRSLDFSDVDADDEQATKNLAEYLSQFKYYISSYSMRLIFSDNNDEFFDEANNLGFLNVQVVKSNDEDDLAEN